MLLSRKRQYKEGKDVGAEAALQQVVRSDATVYEDLKQRLHDVYRHTAWPFNLMTRVNGSFEFNMLSLQLLDMALQNSAALDCTQRPDCILLEKMALHGNGMVRGRLWSLGYVNPDILVSRYSKPRGTGRREKRSVPVVYILLERSPDRALVRLNHMLDSSPFILQAQAGGTIAKAFIAYGGFAARERIELQRHYIQ